MAEPRRNPDLETTGITMPRMAAFYDAMVWVFSLGRQKRLRQETLELARVAAAGPGKAPPSRSSRSSSQRVSPRSTRGR